MTDRPKFKKYFSKTDTEALLETIDKYAEFINVSTVTDICRDPKDNFLLSLSLDGHADFLITGDNDLLQLKKMGKTKIITITEYLDKI